MVVFYGEALRRLRSRPAVGATILSAAQFLSGAADIVRNGHERFDGTGYPRGLEGADVPLPTRIPFAGDAFEAMLPERPYRSVISEEAALDQVRRGAGRQFDPDVVDAFCAEHRALAAASREAARGQTAVDVASAGT